jgi:L-iditol 2-dehydrogenase
LSAVESLQTQIAQRPNPSSLASIPREMRAAVYTGNGRVEVRTVPTPVIGPGEILVRVESCGICHTDLKKIENDLLPPPRIFGHETAGVIAAVGSRVTKYLPGDRVTVFHHVPCGDCFYCLRKLYAQCAIYKKVGVTAGFEPAGGGFSQYVRVMEWIVERGVERIPANVPFDQASFLEPVNTCLKALNQLDICRENTVAVLGQGPIGLIFTKILCHNGVLPFATDTIAFRRQLSTRFGAKTYDPRDPAFEQDLRSATAGRGADFVILATSAPGLVEQALSVSRPGAKILLFAQTSAAERIECSGADVCVGERMLLGSYSADIDLQSESARLVFDENLSFEDLISDRVSLHEIGRGIDIAQHPREGSLKVVVRPQERN